MTIPARLRFAATLLAALLPAAAAAQAPPAFDLSVSNIMRGPELVGDPPQQVGWSDDGRWIFFRWKPGGRPWSEEPALYRASAAGGAPERLSDAAADSLRVLALPGDISADRRWRVSAYRGDLYLVDRRSLAVRRLTDTRAPESDPVLAADGRTVYFLRGGDGPANIFALDLRDGGLRQLTDLRAGPAPKEEKAEGQRKHLEDEQTKLFEHLRLEAARKAHEDSLAKAREARQPKTTYLERDERVLGLAVEPSGRWAVVEIGKPAKDARKAIVPDYVTLSGYTETKEVRTKVGDAEEEGRLALVELGTGALTWIDPAPGAPAADTADRPRHGRFATVRFLGWAPAPERGKPARPALGLVASVSYDYKDQWLGVLDPTTGRVTDVAHDHDDAWIGGPCETWAARCAGWLPDGRTIWFLSERDGFSHLYEVGADGQALRQLTKGPWEVVAAVVSPARDRFFLTTSEGSPFEQHVWTMALDGGPRTRITPVDGVDDAVVAPDGKRVAIIRSLANRPPELFLAEAKAGAPLRQITTSPTAEWLSYHWIVPAIVTFRARDGVEVPARIYRPRDVGARPNGAGVIFVHGAGYLHNVTRGWSTYFREYMFHHLLASRGYTVLDIDYRGSAGYGRDWRTAIYRHMGGKDLTDQLDGLRYLAEHEGVDPARVGIYGGSYGGFITLMALFTEPKAFAAGAALRAVTDWAHYNHWYTHRILNLPQGDTLAYRQSSPIYFAEGLERPLLIAHGMVDTNVHFQDVVRLAQRLIELHKSNWEMAVYPVENHGFVEPSSWSDEYRRILALFDTYLSANGRSRADGG